MSRDIEPATEAVTTKWPGPAPEDRAGGYTDADLAEVWENLAGAAEHAEDDLMEIESALLRVAIRSLRAAYPPKPARVEITEETVDLLRAERDEARDIARVYAKHWPYGRVARDEALRGALCAVPSPSARAPLTAALSGDA